MRIMLPNLETDRLFLRPRTMVDYAECLAMDGDPEVMRYVGGLPASLEEHGIILADRITRAYPPGLGYWSLFPKQSPEQFLGWVLLVPLDRDDSASDVEIGWRLVTSAWGHGYAPEAAAAVLHHAMQSLGLNRLIATIHPENKQFFRVAEKIGMTYIGDGDYFGELCKLYESVQRHP
jgi:RimJ/RimL family protein N-acetyltransferase